MPNIPSRFFTSDALFTSTLITLNTLPSVVLGGVVYSMRDGEDGQVCEVMRKCERPRVWPCRCT